MIARSAEEFSSTFESRRSSGTRPTWTRQSCATTTLCGCDAVQVLRRGAGGGVDLPAVAQALRAHGAVTVNAFMLRANLTDGGRAYELTLFADGRAIVKGTQDAAVAKGVYARYVGA